MKRIRIHTLINNNNNYDINKYKNSNNNNYNDSDNNNNSSNNDYNNNRVCSLFAAVNSLEQTSVYTFKGESIKQIVISNLLSKHKNDDINILNLIVVCIYFAILLLI